MTSLDIAMTTTEARQVTTRIKLLIGSIAEATEKVLTLIEQAEAGKAWRALEYDSWTAYVAAEFSDALTGLARAERLPIAAKLSKNGMSVRAVASVTGTSVSTAHHDIASAGVRVPNTSTTGTDGKTYLRNGKPTARAMQELADAVPAPRPAAGRRRPLVDAYWDLAHDLERRVERLAGLHADERFGRNRERVAGHRAQLVQARDALDRIIRDLGGDAE
jgi:hypothetical protein